MTPALRVGSWPGYLDTQNSFLTVFLDGLAASGADIVSLDSVDEIGPALPSLDVVVLHWPQRVFWEAQSRAEVFRNLLQLLRALHGRGSTTAVWLAHDLRPHDASGLQALLWRPFMAALVANLDAVCTLSPSTLPVVTGAHLGLRTKPGHAIVHPEYPDQSATPAERHSARHGYGFDADDLVLGYCGQLRYNKGVVELVDQFRRWDRADARLLVAGRPMADDIERDLEAGAGDDRRIVLDMRDLAPDEFRRLLSACDLVVAPFRDYLHSGSLLHALSADRAVLTSATPFARDLQDELGASWVRLLDGDLSPQSFERALTEPLPTGSAPLDAYAADAIGASFHDWLVSLARPGQAAP